MMKLRGLSPSGIEEFRKYISNLKQNSATPRPDLNTAVYSFEYKPAPEIDENIVFKTRLEMGKYLTECFQKGGVKRENVIGAPSVWSWLAYIWFDQITENGKRLRESAIYLCSSDFRDYYRHSVACAYSIYSSYGEENSGLFLDTELYRGGDFVEQVASREFIISNPNLIKVIYALYWDAKAGKAKRGATNRKKPGNIRQFVDFLHQIDLTYDICASPEKIIGLLPGEFKPWLNPSPSRGTKP